MRLAPVFVVLSAWLLAGSSTPEIAPLTPRELAGFVDDHDSYRSYPQAPLAGWEQDLRRNLRGADLDRAADALAPRYGLSSTNMRALVRLWLTARIRQFSARRDPIMVAELRRQLLALLPATHRTPLTLQAVAESVNWLEECSADDFAAMMAGSTDPAADAWAIANVAPCNGNFLRAAAAAPNRAMPALIRLVHFGALDSRDRLPVYRWLTSPAALARIAEPDRPLFSAWLYARYAKLLFEFGLGEQAVALIEGLPQELRRRVLALPAGTYAARIDDVPVSVELEHPEENLKIALAAYYALHGRPSDAETLLASLAGLPAARHAFECAWEASGATGCNQIPFEQRVGRNIDLLLLDHLLHHPGDDPYPLAEAGLSGMDVGPDEPLVELRCHIFSEAGLAEICETARRSRLYRLTGEPGQSGAAEGGTLDMLRISGLVEARAEIDAALAPLIAAAGGAETGIARARRTTVISAPPPFAELALPSAYRGPRPAATRLPAGVAPLPEGFLQVRFERNGDRAVAISLSQTYDPTGEVSQGGYWVHLSDDGGRHWQRPLYTGLSDRFPYVVPSASLMPLLNGDRLDLEVEVAELDTASIFYPPVALRSRRQARNLYLQIPLAELARDGNGDGITDIAAGRLLLDRARTDGGTPFVIGTDAGTDCGAPDRDRAARIALLGQLFAEGGRAIVEPLDRPPGVAGFGAGWRSSAAALDRPIFIRGDARDYVCLRPNRMMIVYSEDDLTALGRFHPDFHAVEVPRIVFNRARDRGYVQWSAGWTGGTYRLRLVNGAWIVETIGSWIT